MSEKTKISFTRSPWRVLTLTVIIIALAMAMIFSYIFMTGGDRPSDEVNDPLVTNDVWSKTLAYANRSENRASLRVEDSLITVDNGLLAVELDKTSPYLSKVFGSESGRVLFLSLPTVKMYGSGREFTLSGTEWTVPLNTAYSASASFDASLTAEGREDEFIALKTFEIDDKTSLSNWSMIQGGCKIKLGEEGADLTVNGTTSPYFGAGDLDVDLTDVPAEAVGCIRLKLKGSGLTSIEANYSTFFDTIRLQGVSGVEVTLGDDWTYVTIPVTDGSFVGKLYTLYFRLSVSLDATLTVASVEVGYIDTFKAPLEIRNTCTVYSDRYVLSSSLTSTRAFTPDAIWTETVIPAEELHQIEIITDGNSAFYKPADMTLMGADYTVFHFASGEAVMLMPLSDALTGKIEISLTDEGRIVIKNHMDPALLGTEGGKTDLSCRMEYASSELLQDFSDSYNEETRVLTEADITLSRGSFEGYDRATGRYVLACDENGSLDFSVTSKDSRYVYLYIKGAKDHLSIRNSQGNRLPLNPMGGDNATVGIYLESGEEMSLSITSLEDKGMLNSFLDAIGYRNASGKDIRAVFTSAEYICCSDLYTEIKYIGATTDGASAITLTLISFADGENPVYCYDLDISFKRNVTLSSLTENLCLFSFDREGKTGLYYTDVSDGISYKSEKDMDASDAFTLSTLSPAVAVTTEEGHVMGIVINSYSSTANILPLSSVLHAGYNEKNLFISGTGNLLDSDTGSFGLGDHIRLKGVVSASDTEKAEELINRIRAAYGSGYITVAERGTVTEGVIPTVKLSSSGTALFNVRGGTATLPVKVEGVHGYAFPTVKVNGQPFTPAGYSAYMDGDGTVGFVFSVPCNARVEVS